MKKIILFLIVIIVIGLTSCDGNTDIDKNNDIIDTDSGTSVSSGEIIGTEPDTENTNGSNGDGNEDTNPDNTPNTPDTPNENNPDNDLPKDDGENDGLWTDNKQ